MYCKIFLIFNFVQDFDDNFPIKDVTLVVIKNNENVAESLNQLLKDENISIPKNVVEDEHVKGIIIIIFVYLIHSIIINIKNMICKF